MPNSDGNPIALEAFGQQDFERLMSWVHSVEELTLFAGSVLTYPLTVEQLEGYVADPDRRRYRVLHRETRDVIGHAEIYTRGETPHLARILIGDNRYRRRGLCRPLVERLLEICRRELGAARVDLNVYEQNTTAIRCYRHCGFQVLRTNPHPTMVRGQAWTSFNMTREL